MQDRIFLLAFAAAVLPATAAASDESNDRIVISTLDGGNAAIDAAGDIRFDLRAAEDDLAGEQIAIDVLADGGELHIEGFRVPGLTSAALTDEGAFVSYTGGPVAQTREHVLLARQVSVGYLELVPTAVRFRAEVIDRAGTEVVFMDVAFSLDAVVETDNTGRERVLWEAGDLASALPYDTVALTQGTSTAGLDITVPTSTGLIGVEPDEID